MRERNAGTGFCTAGLRPASLNLICPGVSIKRQKLRLKQLRRPEASGTKDKIRYSVRSIALPARRAPYTLRCDGGGATNRTTCSSRSGLNGFAMHTTAPS